MPVLLSHRYGLKGKLDVLVRTPVGALIPVERKNTPAPRRPHQGDLIQAAAYCLLVEDHYGQTPQFYAHPVCGSLVRRAVQGSSPPMGAADDRLRVARSTEACNRSTVSLPNAAVASSGKTVSRRFDCRGGPKTLSLRHLIEKSVR